MHSSNIVWVLIARCLSGEASVEETDALQNMLNDDESLQQQFELLSHLWPKNNLKNNSSTESEDVERIILLANAEDRQQHFIDSKRRRNLVLFITSIAASLLIVLSIFFLGKDNSSTKNSKTNDEKVVSTANGNRTKIILPDGTLVWLNNGSKITYNNFEGKFREVKLEGEAYFDVVKNAAKPFIVHSGGINIKVLGTAFDVKSYAADKTVETTLLRGVVQITRDFDEKRKPVYLYPNEKITIEKIVAANNSKLLSITKNDSLKTQDASFQIAKLDSTLSADAQIETAWLYNRIAFRGDDFETLAQKLERWYNIKVIFLDQRAKHLSFNGSFENETVEQAFKALQSAVFFNYKINGNEIFISME